MGSEGSSAGLFFSRMQHAVVVPSSSSPSSSLEQKQLKCQLDSRSSLFRVSCRSLRSSGSRMEPNSSSGWGQPTGSSSSSGWGAPVSTSSSSGWNNSASSGWGRTLESSVTSESGQQRPTSPKPLSSWARAVSGPNTAPPVPASSRSHCDTNSTPDSSKATNELEKENRSVPLPVDPLLLQAENWGQTVST